MGTWKPTKSGYKFSGSRAPGLIDRVRDAGGRFKRTIPSIVIVAMIFMIIGLGIQSYINFHRINALEARITNTHTATILIMKEGNKMVLDATLGQIAAIEKDRKENTFDMLNLVENSTDLTANLKDQIVTKRKLDALTQ